MKKLSSHFGSHCTHYVWMQSRAGHIRHTAWHVQHTTCHIWHTMQSKVKQIILRSFWSRIPATARDGSTKQSICGIGQRSQCFLINPLVASLKTQSAWSRMFEGLRLLSHSERGVPSEVSSNRRDKTRLGFIAVGAKSDVETVNRSQSSSFSFSFHENEWKESGIFHRNSFCSDPIGRSSAFEIAVLFTKIILWRGRGPIDDFQRLSWDHLVKGDTVSLSMGSNWRISSLKAVLKTSRKDTFEGRRLRRFV